PMDPIGVACTGSGPRHVAVPVEDGVRGDVDALLVALVVEEAELHALGVLGEEREVRPLAVPQRAERERLAGPDLHQRISAVKPAKSATSSRSPRRTRSTRRDSSASVSTSGGSERRSEISSA